MKEVGSALSHRGCPWDCIIYVRPHIDVSIVSIFGARGFMLEFDLNLLYTREKISTFKTSSAIFMKYLALKQRVIC